VPLTVAVDKCNFIAAEFASQNYITRPAEWSLYFLLFCITQLLYECLTKTRPADYTD
jgi:hypothetical protein